MREAEIAALTDAVFDTGFDQNRALVVLGTHVSTENLGGSTVTYLRPDARALARVEVFARAPEGGATNDAFIEDVIIVLRGSRVYSRAQLEGYLGPSRKGRGPDSEEGDPSWQLEFPQEGEVSGSLMLRWWQDPGDAPGMGEPTGPDEVRIDELHMHRAMPGRPESIPAPRPSRMPPALVVDMDEAMDTGAWVADLAWRVLRPDFSLQRAQELFGRPAGHVPATGLLALEPADPRLQLAIVALEDGRVASVRLDAPEHAPIQLATDAIADRLDATPVVAEGVVRFRFEATRSRGNVTLVLAHGWPLGGPVIAVAAVELVRD